MKQRKLMLRKDELQIFYKTIGIDLPSDKQIYNGTVISGISGGSGGPISKFRMIYKFLTKIVSHFN